MQTIPTVDTTPDCLVMIRPTDFGFNEQTAEDNLFQHHVSISDKEVIQKAQKEFDNYVALLREKDVKVIVLDKSRCPEIANVYMPDDVFPNWFSTEPSGMLVLYRMHTQLRENEKALLNCLEKALYDEGYQVTCTISIGCRFDRVGVSLEGTGSVVFDRTNKVAFFGASQRSNLDHFNTLCKSLGYRGVTYETEMTNRAPFYHSDLFFCLGQKFAIISLEGIKETQREMVKQELISLGKEIIEITLEQVEKSFCGNILEIKSKKDGKRYIIMSKKAYKGFTDEQLTKISNHCEILSVDIETIEEVGGGSAKCMLTECLLPMIPGKKPMDADRHPYLGPLEKTEDVVSKL